MSLFKADEVFALLTLFNADSVSFYAFDGGAENPFNSFDASN